MSVPQIQSWTEEQIAERHRLTTLPQPQVQKYFTGRFTQLDALQDTRTDNAGWEHFAEIATTKREWVPILTTAPGYRNRIGVPYVPANLLGHHNTTGIPNFSAEVLGQHDGSGAPDVSAQPLGQHDEHGTPNIPTELLEQHGESGTPNAPTELVINGVVYHRSSYDHSEKEPSGNQFDPLHSAQVATPDQQSAASQATSSWILESGARLRPHGVNPVSVTW